MSNFHIPGRNPEELKGQTKVQVHKAINENQTFPVITFFCPLDPDLIISKAHEKLNEKFPKWESEKGLYSLKVILPEENE
jgi:hypothetical protein